MNGGRISFNGYRWSREFLLCYELFYHVRTTETRATPVFAKDISLYSNTRM